MGNLVAACSGVFFASQGDINWALLGYVALGTSCVVASGCIFNNYIDRDIDGKMQRTKRRGFVLNTVHVPKSLILASLLGLLGITVLHVLTNWYAVFFATLGFFVYVCLYSLYFKRQSVHGVLIGSASGACPPVIGYVAVTGLVDWASVLLFLMYCIWQLPHSYAIAVYRRDDYKAANIPILPVIRGVASARNQILIYISLFLILCTLMTLLGYTGYTYLFGMLAVNSYWLYLALKKDESTSMRVWGKKVFFMSIAVIMTLSVLISTNYIQRVPLAVLEF